MNATPALNEKKFHLPQLDGLRFFAFFLVFMRHYNPMPDSFKANHGLLWAIEKKFFAFGWIGVDFFLCLSSFLLTSLIIMEYRKTGQFSIKNFLIRRMLRIWPLYYLILLLAFVILPFLNYLCPPLHSPEYHLYVKQHLLPLTLFLGNFSYAFFANSLTAVVSPLWSVSLEEQFYVFCPLVLLILLPKNKIWFIAFFTLMICLSLIVRFYIIANAIPYPTIWVFSLARLEPFAMGALLSYFYLSNRFKHYSIYAFFAFIFSILLFKLLMASSYSEYSNYWYLFGIDLACLLMIYAVIQSKTLAKFFSIQFLTWLGKISFGLYVFHKIVIYFMDVTILPHFYNIIDVYHRPFQFYLFSFCLTLIGTVIVAALSYYYFERYFLKFKNSFTTISSRPI